MCQITTSLLLLFLLCVGAQASDFAAWAKKNPDGSWTKTALEAVSTSLLASSIPDDIQRFCPAYQTLDTDKRNMFWVGLLSAMARPESNFKPATKFTESFSDSSGRKVISRGLLQISIESANQSRYGCNIKKAEDLHIPAVNLACSVKILSAWVRSDNVIATYKIDSENRGGGRYWSVLRESQGHLPELAGFTSRLSFCKQAS